MNREELFHKNPYHYVVCERHFDTSSVLVNASRKILKKDAVPTLLMPDLPQRVINNRKADFSTQTDEESFILNRKRKHEDCKSILNINGNKMKTLYKLCDTLLPKELADLVKAQTHLNIHRKESDTLVNELFCLHLYYASPQAYRLLQRCLCLPSTKSLAKSFLPVTSEVNSWLIMALKTKVDNMTDTEKVCSVVVSTVSLRTNIFYNISQDRIIGLNEIDGVQTLLPAKNALVFLVQGIQSKWTQPIAFSLLAENNDSKKISTWIDILLEELLDIGLDIRTFVSDLGVLNVMKQRSVSVPEPYFYIKDRKIYYILDTLEMMKCMIIEWMSSDFHYQGSIAKWEHIKQLFECDKKKSRRLAPRLTKTYFKQKNVEKMNIGHVSHLMSRCVATGISTYVDFLALDESARQTEEFISLMSELLNVLHPVSEHKKVFSNNKSNTEVLVKMLNFFSSLSIINSNKRQVEPSNNIFIEGFLITIKSVILLLEDLKREDCKFLFTRRLNIGEINKSAFKFSNLKKPTCRQFIEAFKKVLLSNIMTPPKHLKIPAGLTNFLRNAENVENLLCNVSSNQTHSNDLVQVKEEPHHEFTLTNNMSVNESAYCIISQTTNEVTVKEEPSCEMKEIEVKVEPSYGDVETEHAIIKEEPSIDITETRDVIVKEEYSGEGTPTAHVSVTEEPSCQATKSESIIPRVSSDDYDHLVLPDKNTLMYICVYLLKKCAEQDRHCKLLKSYMHGEQIDGLRILVPPADFVRLVQNMEVQFEAFFKSNSFNGKVFESIFQNVADIEFVPPCLCFPLKYLKTLYIRMRIYHTVKFFNRIFRAGSSKQVFLFGV